MANYYAFARSNYFMVKDEAAFAGLCKKWNVELVRGGDGDKLFGFLCPEAEMGIPLSVYDEAKDEDVEGDFIADLATHLADGWVAIVREIGYEKMRYLVGYTVAVNSKGQKRSVDLNEIYRKAQRLGEHVTECEYCTQYLRAGSRVLVSGLLDQRRWADKDGTQQSTLRVRARRIQFLDKQAEPTADAAAEPS